MTFQKTLRALIALIALAAFVLLQVAACVPDVPDLPGDGGGDTGAEDLWEDFTPTVNGDDLLNVNKKQYLVGEEIYVTAHGEGDAWVGCFLAGDTSKKYIKWYYVARNGFVSGTTYPFTRSATTTNNYGHLETLPAGQYTLKLFGDYNGSIVLSSLDIEILDEELTKPKAPIKLQYKLDNASDGLADGTLRVTFDEDYCAEEVVLYWANSDGPLSDYTALATFVVTQQVNDLQMYQNTIIPPDATMLYAYGKNSVGLSDNCCKLILPKDCQYKFDGQVIESFQVVSDIHIGIEKNNPSSDAYRKKYDEHLRAMCADVLATDKDSSAIFVVGDSADTGLAAEWERALGILGGFEQLPPVYFALGNHDLFGSDVYDQAVSTFKQYAQTDNVYYEKEINGYHHLFLGSESRGGHADLSQRQLDWFDSRLSQITSANPDKPVFVYLHQSLYKTVAGGFEGQGWNGVVQDGAFKAIVAKYPQIYMFNGHSHWDLNTRGSMHDRSDGLPNIFNTASVAYLWNSFYVPLVEYAEGSQGYYVKVYKDKVLVLGRDFVNNRWLPSACFETKI